MSANSKSGPPRGPLTPRTLEEHLEQAGKSGQFAPIYIVDGGAKNEGTDRIAISRAVSRIQQTVLPDGPSEWSLTILSADRTSLSEILDCALTLPLFGERRLVLVRGVSDLSCAKDDAGQKEQIDTLRRIGRVGAGEKVPTVLLFVEPPLDGRLKIHKAIVEHACVVSCKRPSIQEMPGWIAAEARAQGLELARGSAGTLAAIAGNDTGRARRELEKLSIYVGAGRTRGAPHEPAGADRIARAPTPADIAALAAGGTLADSWRLCDAIAALDEREALTLARELTTAGEEEIAILGAIAFRVRQMIQAAEAVDAGVPPSALASRLRIWGTAKDAIERNVRRYHPEGIASAPGMLLAADRSIKRGGDSREALYSAISGIIRAAAAREERPRPGGRPQPRGRGL